MQRVAGAFQRVVQGKQPNYRLEKRYIRKDGDVVWGRLSVRLLKDGAGQPVTLRELLVHMIEEYARHNGHADLLRERIDGRVGQ